MKPFFGTLPFICLAAACPGLAANPQVRLDMKFKRNDQLISSPVTVNELGKEVTVIYPEQNGKTGYAFQAIPTLSSETNHLGKPAIRIDFKLYEISGGRQKLLSRPTVITLNGHFAEITEESPTGGKIALEVKPTL